MAAPRYRRRSVLGAGISGAGGLLLPAWNPNLWSPERAAALRSALSQAATPDGTTLVSTIELRSGDGYSSLRSGPGWPTVPRTELIALETGRHDRRRALASFVHLTDIHIVDAQSPGRVEYLDDVNVAFSAAFRPQELLTTHVQASMTQRIRHLRFGPITGRRFDCAVSTGDNIDNQQHNELDWFIGVLDGGAVTPNSGADDYEGVQRDDWADQRYWHPETGGVDRYAADRGFPVIAGMLRAAVAPLDAPGLDIAWYSTYGNHDGLLQGNLARTDAIDQLLMGSLKVTGAASGDPLGLIATFAGDTASVPARVASGELLGRSVTADPARRSVTTSEWVQAHLDSTHAPSPAGHGYDESHLDGTALFYRFEIAPGVTGLSLDTGGYNSGSIGESQLDWLERQLRSLHSVYFSADGREICTTNDDHLVVVFSHFTSATMTGSTDPTRPAERRVQGPELVATLLRYRNVIAWVNGHTHSNTIAPIADPQRSGGGFWEITTASHIDFPEQARILEVVDNDDGTLSIFTTMIEHAAPPIADYGDLSALGLAAISRELAANNDTAVGRARHLGEAASLNTELGLAAPFPLTLLSRASAQENAAEPSAPEPTTSTGAASVGLGIATAVALGGGAIALRRRNQRVPYSDETAVEPGSESAPESELESELESES